MRPHVLILGGGFGGAYCAKSLRNLRDIPCDISLIDAHNYFIFYPLLIEACTGRIEPRHAVVPLRPYLKGIHFLSGRIESIDFAGQKVRYEIPINAGIREVSWDHLVIALGSHTRMINIPGLG